jgi:AraC-like DNA-binding protein
VTGSSGISIWTQRLDQFTGADFHAFFFARRDWGSGAESSENCLWWIMRQGSVASGALPRPDLTFVNRKPAQAPTPIILFDDDFGEARSTGVKPTDMALALIERDLGSDIARKIAHVLKTSLIEHTQSELGDASVITTSKKIRESALWFGENYSKPVSVAQAAEAAAMSRRNFQRRFKAEFDMTPHEYLLRIRFDAVCTLLKHTNLPVDKIARRCGMVDGNRLGRFFKERCGMSPTQFRSRQCLGVEERYPAPDRGVGIATELLRKDSESVQTPLALCRR